MKGVKIEIMGNMYGTINIAHNVDRDFELSFSDMKHKYGESFEYLNGFHMTQLNNSNFIDGFIDKNVADATIDSSANVSNKDIRSLISEKGKSEDKLFAFNKIFYDTKKIYGLKTAKSWFETEWNGGFYLHDAHTSSFYGYCFSGETKILTDKGIYELQNLVGDDIKVLNKNHGWENATVRCFGVQPLRKLTLKRNNEIKEVFVTGNHRWFILGDTDDSDLKVVETDNLKAGDWIPYNYPNPDKKENYFQYLDNWMVISREETDRVEPVYCAVVPGTESFTLDGNILTHNCFAYDLTRLATEGLFFLNNYNNEAPKHLTTFVDDLVEYISYMCNRSAGELTAPLCYFSNSSLGSLKMCG